MSNQGLRQASARAIYGGTANVPYEEDFQRLFTFETIPASGTFNERFLLWLNYRLSRTYTNLPEAMTAFAISRGVSTWGDVGTFPSAATLPVNTVAPVISGTITSGQVLTSTTGTWTGTAPITYAYQWKRGVTDVGTNANTYTLVAGDVGSNMTCVVTATNAAGSVSATSNSLGPVVAPAAAWNPSDRAAAITLSNSDRTATVTGSSYASVRSVTSHATGKWHFEATIDVQGSDTPAIGVANATATLSNYFGVDANALVYFVPEGNIYQNGVIASPGLFTSGTVAVEVDADTRQIWFQHTSGSRVGPYSITTTDALFVGGTCRLNGQITINTGQAAFAITPTSGFTAWG